MELRYMYWLRVYGCSLAATIAYYLPVCAEPYVLDAVHYRHSLLAVNQCATECSLVGRGFLLTHIGSVIITFLRDTAPMHVWPDPFSLFAIEGAGQETRQVLQQRTNLDTKLNACQLYHVSNL